MTNKKIDKMINIFSISKTIRNKLKPVGKTEDNFKDSKILDYDSERKENYTKVKKLIDEYHKHYIEQSLSKAVKLESLKAFADEYYDKHDKKNMEKLEEALRKEVLKLLNSSEIYKLLFKKEFITEILPDFLENSSGCDYTEELEMVKSFANFSTYFTNFFENRKNMYTDKEQSTGIPYRCINNNLPKHLDNILSYKKAKEKLDVNIFKEIDNSFKGIYNTKVDDVFTVDYFTLLLPQSSIDMYNQLIGGYTKPDGIKIQGLNEYINLYNQQVSKKDRIPNLQPLYKQILSDRDTISFIPEMFADDNELINAVLSIYTIDKPEKDFLSIKTINEQISSLFSEFNIYNIDGIYIQNGSAITDLSNRLFKSWSVLKSIWNDKYDSENMPKKVKDFDKYEEKRTKDYKSNKSFSLGYLQSLIDNSDLENKPLIVNYYKGKVSELIADINLKYEVTEELLCDKYYTANKSLKKDEEAVRLVKDFLDSIKALESFIKPLVLKFNETDTDQVFYGKFNSLFDGLTNIDFLYNKVRNYVTQKPYSTEQIKLNFENPQFLGGWDRNKEKDYYSVMLMKDNRYYLGIMKKGNNKIFDPKNVPKCDNKEDCYKKMVYKLLPGPNKMLPKVFFAKSNIDYYSPSPEITALYKKGTFKKGNNFNVEDCHKLIDFYKESIAKHPDWSAFNFDFKDIKDYNDIGEFYNDVKVSAYKITFTYIPNRYISELVDDGKLYLFQIYNKDFSEYSKGTPNLHTLYFKMLFDERNLKNVVYKLDGGAELFYRPASIKKNDAFVHYANIPIKNKNPHTDKYSSVFEYDLTKDRRFTKPQFTFHTPITLNFKAKEELKINDRVRNLLKECEDNYVIGIDRGERHLIYVTVVNSKGEIQEQYSLNEIVNEYNGKSHKIDYHKLLDTKENEIKNARRNWTTIENIKELKEGYISQVVNKICKLIIKYDAIVVMENLNSGFKRSRVKVEKQVYQKFEKMLIDKLNFLVDKKLDPEEIGGLLHAYQLTNKFESFSKIGLQNGFIFYIPAWLTSKIDPVTGFVNLLRPRYESVEKSKDFISRFDSIEYNSTEDYFEFAFNYDKFSRGSTDYRKEWTVCTNGERIKTFRNKDKNSEWDSETIVLTQSFKELFNDYNINYSNGDIKNLILAQDKKDFFARFTNLLSLTLQMRNSVSNTNIDYLISPVKDKNGKFYNSNNYDDSSILPANADANGAYNIARKGLWAIEQIKKAEDVGKVKLSISNKEWLKYAQSDDLK